MAGKLFLTCSLILVVFSVVLSNNLVTSNERDDEPRVSKLSQNAGAPTIQFLYCYSCGYSKAFDDYTNLIAQKYGYITVKGRNYDPPGLNMFIARAIGILKILVIMCIMGGVNIFNYINQPPQSWWTWCTDNKLYSCLMLFFLCNLVEGQLVQSGAFEISLNDVPIWSKLETGRIPQPNELFQIIDNFLRLTDRTIDLNNNFAK